jgi:hypothetical protein
MKTSVALPLLLGLIGCGASVDSGADANGKSGQLACTAGTGSSVGNDAAAEAGRSSDNGVTAVAGAAGTGGSPSAGATPVAPASTCPKHEPLNSHEFSSIADKQQALVGRWIQCSTQGIGPDDAVGIEIAADGQFTILVRGADDKLVPGVGVLHQGRAVATANDVEFRTANATESSRMLFSDETPYRMYAFNTDFIGYDYVRTSADDVE